MQLPIIRQELQDEAYRLHKIYGNSSLEPIIGGGQIQNPDMMFIFMNPTAKNIASFPSWTGIRTPWLGTKHVWKIFHSIGKLSTNIYEIIAKIRPEEWTTLFAEEVYRHVAENNMYITNLAKCTQEDARPLSNNIFKDYLALMYREIELVKPKYIISFGNQVSSILLQKSISVSTYDHLDKEILTIENQNYDVFPTYYPVGQGMRNLPMAIERIKMITQN
ncbi:MAG: uracil-DNA glycosylase family protein [Candidatus Dojkabacteria bacterium]|nr:MAG: uracil-DNA glycosylase family protein [Candidatus Dojkabacteria bacterium]